MKPEAVVASSIGEGGGVSILELLRMVYGKERTAAALKRPSRDPDFVEFALLVDARVNQAWRARGIKRAQGPYVESSEASAS